MNEVGQKYAEEQLRSKLKSRALRKCDSLVAVRSYDTMNEVYRCQRPARDLAASSTHKAKNKVSFTAWRCDTNKQIENFLVQAMVECSKDRLFSVAWACRDHLRDLNACTHQWTSDEQLEDVKRRYAAAGKPSYVSFLTPSTPLPRCSVRPLVLLIAHVPTASRRDVCASATAPLPHAETGRGIRGLKRRMKWRRLTRAKRTDSRDVLSLLGVFVPHWPILAHLHPNRQSIYVSGSIEFIAIPGFCRP